MTPGRRRKTLREAIKHAERSCRSYERLLQAGYLRLVKAQFRLYQFEAALIDALDKTCPEDR